MTTNLKYKHYKYRQNMTKKCLSQFKKRFCKLDRQDEYGTIRASAVNQRVSLAQRNINTVLI